VEVELHSFLTSALDWSKWQASHSDRFTPGKTPPETTELEAGWDPEPVWMLSKKKEMSCTSLESNHDAWVVRPVACYCTTTLPQPQTLQIKRLTLFKQSSLNRNSDTLILHPFHVHLGYLVSSDNLNDCFAIWCPFRIICHQLWGYFTFGRLKVLCSVPHSSYLS
jgi:hypothetical protein